MKVLFGKHLHQMYNWRGNLGNFPTRICRDLLPFSPLPKKATCVLVHVPCHHFCYSCCCCILTNPTAHSGNQIRRDISGPNPHFPSIHILALKHSCHALPFQLVSRRWEESKGVGVGADWDCKGIEKWKVSLPHPPWSPGLPADRQTGEERGAEWSEQDHCASYMLCHCDFHCDNRKTCASAVMIFKSVHSEIWTSYGSGKRFEGKQQAVEELSIILLATSPNQLHSVSKACL